jgi:hypothetical protein
MRFYALGLEISNRKIKKMEWDLSKTSETMAFGQNLVWEVGLEPPY